MIRTKIIILLLCSAVYISAADNGLESGEGNSWGWNSGELTNSVIQAGTSTMNGVTGIFSWMTRGSETYQYPERMFGIGCANDEISKKEIKRTRAINRDARKHFQEAIGKTGHNNALEESEESFELTEKEKSNIVYLYGRRQWGLVYATEAVVNISNQDLNNLRNIDNIERSMSHNISPMQQAQLKAKREAIIKENSPLLTEQKQ